MDAEARAITHPARATFRNTNRLYRIAYRIGPYARTVAGAIDRLPIKELVRAQFPFWMADAAAPPTVSLELTNFCNLACAYCSNPTTARPRGMMSEATFSRLLDEARRSRIFRVLIVGNGEPTLHPRFAEYVRRLSRAVPYVSLTSNWQRVDDRIALATVESVRLINVSVDGTTEAFYEEQRRRGNFKRLVGNLRRLVKLRQSTGSRTLINIRVMIGTTDRSTEREISRVWASYGDVVSKQYILDYGSGHPRSFLPVSTGRCTLPFKVLDVHWNGVVPLCSYSDLQTGNPEGLVLGNIRKDSLTGMWNSALMRQYRQGHRLRQEAMIPMCKGCPGRT
jgi:MoaA/NifB/PqqE/SkfB family radical SAM enzyme